MLQIPLSLMALILLACFNMMLSTVDSRKNKINILGT